MKRFRHIFVVGGLLCVSLLVGGELFARYYLGLGTPPLYIAHPQIEYMLKPDQNVNRFGNQIIINSFGMRTCQFALKSDNEYRIMFFGDSVLNGGAQTDHSALATTLLQENLQKKLKKKVVVGNISAGSWGPGNWLAYAKEYGFFDAGIVGLVLSSHDCIDNPTYAPLNDETHPEKAPLSAMLEGFTRYLPRYLLSVLNSQKSTSQVKSERSYAKQEVAIGLRDLRYFLELAKEESGQVVVFLHWERSEVKRGYPDLGNSYIEEVCNQVGVEVVQLGPEFQREIENGENLYRDNIHPDLQGQQLMARIFERILINKE